MSKETGVFTKLQLGTGLLLNGLFLCSLFFIGMHWFERASKCVGLSCIGIVYNSLVLVFVSLFITPLVFIIVFNKISWKNYFLTLVSFAASFAALVIFVLMFGIIDS